MLSLARNTCMLIACIHPPQRTPNIPQNPGAPGRVSYGAYLTLISMITFGLWLMSVVVALLIAAQLCWLMLAFMFEAAVARGVA